jgi:STE24 endopeptidase
MDAPDPQHKKTYHRIKITLRIVSAAIFLAYAAAWCLFGPGLASQLESTLPNRWLLLFAFCALFALGHELLTLPLSYYSGYIIEHRYDLSNESPKDWLIHQMKGWLVGGILGAILMAGMFALLWYGGSLWWLWTLAGWLSLTVILAQLFPVIILPIFYKSELLKDDAMVDRLTRLSEGTGIQIQGVFNLALSQETKKANAMLAGLGNTRRVFLSDTLLDAFSPEEIEVVFAHELGHHVRGHIWKGLGMTAVVGLLMVLLLAWRLGPFAGFDPATVTGALAALPQVFIAVTLLSLITSPITNAVSRRFEVQCDTDALTRTGHRQAYVSAFEKLGDMNLSDPEPHPWIEFFFHDHPALSKRIALADHIDAPA